jgi:hypothetical protein
MHRVDAMVMPDNPFAAPVIGHPTLWVRIEGELTPATILAAMHAGEVSISDTPDGPHSAIEGATVRVVRGNGCALLTIADGEISDARAVMSNDESFDIVWPNDVEMIRFEVHGARGGVRALSNAIRKP